MLYQSLKESGCHDDTESLELMTQLYEYYKTTPYPPATTWRFYISGYDLYLKNHDLHSAFVCLEEAEKLLLSCRDKETEDYKLLEEKKSKI